MSGLAREPWGEVDGVLVERFVLERGALRAVFTNYGATLLALEVPDRHGVRADVVLGFDTLAEYASPRNPYCGSLVGRSANRIAGARFELDGRVHELAANEGRHHLHGGRRGFDRRVWAVEFDARAGVVAFTRTSPAGEEGYPGELRVRATYRWLDGKENGELEDLAGSVREGVELAGSASGERAGVARAGRERAIVSPAFGERDGSMRTLGALELEIAATCDAPTLWNPTQHTYWNLAGGGDVSEHVLELAASRYLEVDAELIPTGRILPVERSPLDLRSRLDERSGRRLGDAIAALARTPAGGVDHAFALDGGSSDAPRAVCTLAEPHSGRVLEIAATQPCLQVYTGNRLGASDGTSSDATALRGKGGRLYPRHGGVCLEAQGFPDAIHHAQFPSIVLRPGQRWCARTIWRFSSAE